MSSPWAPPPPTSAKAQSTTSSGGSENAPPTTGTTPQNVDVSGLHLEEGDTTTTVAIGQDTYTIGKKS